MARAAGRAGRTHDACFERRRRIAFREKREEEYPTPQVSNQQRRRCGQQGYATSAPQAPRTVHERAFHDEKLGPQGVRCRGVPSERGGRVAREGNLGHLEDVGHLLCCGCVALC